jgi:hypothetical protein
VRGLRINVWDVLGWLGAGMTEDEILEEHRTWAGEQLPHLLGAFREYPVVMPASDRHRSNHAGNVRQRNTIVEQIAHQIDEDRSGLVPAQRLGQLMGISCRSKRPFEGVASKAAKPFSEQLA